METILSHIVSDPKSKFYISLDRDGKTLLKVKDIRDAWQWSEGKAKEIAEYFKLDVIDPSKHV
jgi:hypothetical protein